MRYKKRGSRKYKKEHSLSAKIYTDYKEMIEKERPELIGIATSSGAHGEIAIYAIKKGCNLIIEKPIALSINEAKEIVRLSKKYNVKVSACHQNRFNLAITQMRAALEKGRFGKLSHGSIIVRWTRDREYYSQDNWRGTWAQLRLAEQMQIKLPVGHSQMKQRRMKYPPNC